MNTGRKLVERKQCFRCGNTFLQIGNVKIRTIRPELPDISYITGQPKAGLCNSPRCARFITAVPQEDDDARTSSQHVLNALDKGMG